MKTVGLKVLEATAPELATVYHAPKEIDRMVPYPGWQWRLGSDGYWYHEPAPTAGDILRNMIRCIARELKQANRTCPYRSG